MAISLSSIAKTKHAMPPRILIHGQEKSGKSTFFAGGTINTITGQAQLPSAPKPIFIQTEDGLRGLEAEAFPLATRYQDVVDALGALAQEDHDYKTLVIDSADWLERLIHQQVIDTCTYDVKGVKTMESAHGGYGKAYSVAMSYWKSVLAGLDWLNSNKGMIIGIICHSVISPYNDPSADQPYDVLSLKLHQPKKGTGARDLLSEWADIIGYAEKRVMVSTKKTVDGREISRASAIKGTLNKLHLSGNAAYVAGNRYNLPDTIDLSWGAFEEALKQPTANQQATSQPTAANTDQPTKKAA